MMRPEELAGLTPDARRALLSKLLATRSAAEAAQPSQCSYGQRSLWYMHQVAPESPVYNVPTAWRIRSAIDREALHRAVNTLVARHDVLRTTYDMKDGELCQRVHPQLPDPWEVRNIGSCDDAALHELIIADSRRPFDLVRGPLMRTTLYTRHDADHVLLITIHHIACDQWSIELLFEELGALYAQEAAGRTDERQRTPALADRRYRDFIAWQHAMLNGPDGAAHWDYWRNKLGGDYPRLELPTDRPRPAVQSFETSDLRFTVPADLVSALRRRAAELDSTLFPIFLAAFEALLLRYSGQESVLVGTAASGRSRREFESIVGYFVNPIVLRVDAADDPTFVEFIKRSRAEALSALDHQEYPFPLLVERLKVDRDPSRSPVSDAYFVWDKFRDAAGRLSADVDGTHHRMEWRGLSLEAYPLPMNIPPSDIAMVVFEIDSVVWINLGYAVSLFERETIERMRDHFVQMLRAIAADPLVRVSRVPLCTPEEHDMLMHPVSTPSPAPQVADALHRRFERQALERPDAIALTCGRQQITYRELDARANVLAARLRAAGAARGRIVGVYLDRDVDLVAAILAILKSGAAYLPIDRAYPADRVAFMLRDAGVSLLVSSRSLAPAPDLDGVEVRQVFVDDLAPADLDVRPFDPGTQPDDLAYVIYTSGSTGHPKGVMVTHRNVLRLFDSTAEWFAFTEKDVWTLFHSVAFDFSVWELWGALLFGGRLVVVPFSVTRSPDEFLQVLTSERVTVLNQTPSAFQQLIEADRVRSSRDALALRFVIFGGEALDVRSLRPWFDSRGDRMPALINMFGITETTVHVTYRPITRQDLERRVTSPIGVAIPDLRLLVLDAAGQPVPSGVPGELYVAGAGVARGYLNRPGLEAERFLPDPTSGDPQARVYRTGDLVRFDARGELEYLGRIDQQVKIRGFRIELGEIQAAVSRHRDVVAAAVIVRRDAPGDPRLVAYVVLRDGATIAPADLHAALRRTLPDYMVPAAFVRVEALPLTTNGKLDVRGLPAPDAIEAAVSRPYVAPRNESERAIAAEWARLLKIERVGADDDFFELGGHSILATRLTGWVRTHFGIDFPIYAVFEAPTVAGIAARVETIVAERAPAVVAAEREEFEI